MASGIWPQDVLLGNEGAWLHQGPTRFKLQAGERR